MASGNPPPLLRDHGLRSLDRDAVVLDQLMTPVARVYHAYAVPALHLVRPTDFGAVAREGRSGTATATAKVVSWKT